MDGRGPINDQLQQIEKILNIYNTESNSLQKLTYTPSPKFIARKENGGVLN